MLVQETLVQLRLFLDMNDRQWRPVEICHAMALNAATSAARARANAEDAKLRAKQLLILPVFPYHHRKAKVRFD
jgi:hypothetical protein